MEHKILVVDDDMIICRAIPFLISGHMNELYEGKKILYQQVVVTKL